MWARSFAHKEQILKSCFCRRRSFFLHGGDGWPLQVLDAFKSFVFIAVICVSMSVTFWKGFVVHMGQSNRWLHRSIHDSGVRVSFQLFSFFFVNFRFGVFFGLLRLSQFAAPLVGFADLSFITSNSLTNLCNEYRCNKYGFVVESCLFFLGCGWIVIILIQMGD